MKFIPNNFQEVLEAYPYPVFLNILLTFAKNVNTPNNARNHIRVVQNPVFA